MRTCFLCELPTNRHPKARLCAPCLKTVHALQWPAISAVYHAIQKGTLAPASSSQCADCERTANVYDHRDYHRPLDVVPVCCGCNTRRGHGLPFEAGSIQHIELAA